MRRILRGWMALVLLSVCLVAIPPAVYAASTLGIVWSQTLGAATVHGDEIAAHGQGAATAANCSTTKSAYRAATFDKSKGVTIGSIARDAPQDFCGDTRATGPDGTLYGAGDGLIAAYRQGSRLWQRQPTVACGGSAHALGTYRITLGGDTLWLLASGEGCANGNYLVGLRASDGWQVVTTSLGAATAQWAAAYAQGVAVIQDNSLRYFDANGTQTTAITLPAGTAQNPNQIAITAEGKVIAVQQTAGCATAIRAYQPAGAQWSYLPEGQCNWIPQLRTTPSGGAVFDTSSSGTETVALDAHGRELWRNPIPDSAVQGRTFASGRTGHWLRTDTLGNVIVLRQYSRDSGKYQGYYVGVLNGATGRPTAEFYTDTRITSELSLTASGNIALAPERIYLALTKCQVNPCLNTDPQELYALEAAVGAEYPQAVRGSGPLPTPAPTVSSSPAGPNACPELQFIGVRGSGETANDAGGLGHTIHAVKAVLVPFIKRMDVLALDYPAVPVFAGGLFKYPASYRASVDKGQENLRKTLNSFNSKCPNTPVVLAGYSQGAHVAGDVFQVLPGWRRQIVAVVLIGDPRFNPRQTEVNNGTYSLRLSGAAQLIKLKPRKISTDLVKRVRSYCRLGDPVCNFTPANLARCADSRKCPHMQYVSGHVTDMAGIWATTLVKSQLHHG